jgi:alkylhydroperoxidase/carboxymuconolactone decarboxylase family protein YurZ
MPSESAIRDNAVNFGLFSISLVLQKEDDCKNHIQNFKNCGLPRTSVSEIILQSYLHDGYATALEGMSLLDSVWKRESSENQPTGDWQQWAERGQQLFETIYGNVSSLVTETVNRTCPELSEWMIVEGYGKVLSREGVDIQTREVSTVSVLIAKNRPKQLHSHIRGALRVGVKPEELRKLFDLIDRTYSEYISTTPARNILNKINISE